MHHVKLAGLPLQHPGGRHLIDLCAREFLAQRNVATRSLNQRRSLHMISLYRKNRRH